MEASHRVSAEVWQSLLQPRNNPATAIIAIHCPFTAAAPLYVGRGWQTHSRSPRSVRTRQSSDRTARSRPSGKPACWQDDKLRSRWFPNRVPCVGSDRRGPEASLWPTANRNNTQIFDFSSRQCFRSLFHDCVAGRSRPLQPWRLKRAQVDRGSGLRGGVVSSERFGMITE